MGLVARQGEAATISAIVGTAFALAVTGTAELVRRRNAKKAVVNAMFANREIPGVEHRYVRVSVMERRTRTSDVVEIKGYKKLQDTTFFSIDIGELLGEELGDTVLDLLETAAQKCTDAKPVVWEHLYQMLPVNRRARVMERIAKTLSRKVEGIMNGGKAPFLGALESDQDYAGHQVYPMLTAKKEDGRWYFEFFLLHREHLHQGYFPGPNMLILKDYDGNIIEDNKLTSVRFASPEEKKMLERHKAIVASFLRCRHWMEDFGANNIADIRQARDARLANFPHLRAIARSEEAQQRHGKLRKIL